MNDYNKIFINADAAKIMQAVLRAKAKQEGRDVIVTCRDITSQRKEKAA